MKKITRLILGLFVILLIAFAISGCGKKATTQQTKTAAQGSTQETVNDISAELSDLETIDAELDLGELDDIEKDLDFEI